MHEVNAGSDELEFDCEEVSDEWEEGELCDVSGGCQMVVRDNETRGAKVPAVGVLQKSSADGGGTSKGEERRLCEMPRAREGGFIGGCLGKGSKSEFGSGMRLLREM
ncbi:hypothetical protein NDU88_002367 [Pleurodeles waltl]|uniref:Uncharacterized protein n=1 Tax=Pleurodeles waltl TaxID=8319 RepID=A0AAV7VZ60_PLEWA|nr:hypothetical protein NDU88_002367 [Pleurodeles waltl]